MSRPATKLRDPLNRDLGDLITEHGTVVMSKKKESDVTVHAE